MPKRLPIDLSFYIRSRVKRIDDWRKFSFRVFRLKQANWGPAWTRLQLLLFYFFLFLFLLSQRKHLNFKASIDHRLWPSEGVSHVSLNPKRVFSPTSMPKELTDKSSFVMFSTFSWKNLIFIRRWLTFPHILWHEMEGPGLAWASPENIKEMMLCNDGRLIEQQL